MPLTLPDTAVLGDAGHIADHNLITTALSDLETLVAAAGGGLTHINTTAFTGAGAVNLNNVFTTTYDHYRVLLTMTPSSASAALYCRLRASGTDDSTASAYVQNGLYQAGAGGATAFNSTSTQWTFGGNNGAHFVWLDLLNPKLAVKTGVAVVNQIEAGQWASLSGYHTQATAYDGITFYPNTGNFTGTVRVYGYQNS